MLNARVVVTEIDYEQTFVNVYPAFYKKLDSVESKNIVVQLLRKLGMEAQNIAVELMTMLDRSNKDKLLIYLLESYKEQWMGIMKKYLLTHQYGKYFQLEDIQLTQEASGQLVLMVENIEVDYKGLLRSGLAKPGTAHGLLNLGVGILPEAAMEQIALTILQNEEVSNKLIEAVEAAIRKYGVLLTLDVAEIQKADRSVRIVSGAENTLPDDMGDALLDAVAAYLKRCAGGKRRI